MPRPTKELQKIYVREWRKNRRLKWIYENGPCKKCGSTEQLEVDHIDPSTKVTHKVWTWSCERRKNELAKCQVLCKSCHREKTNQQLSKPLIHGTLHGYDRKKCRCELCKKAKVDAVNEWRWNTGRRKKRCAVAD